MVGIRLPRSAICAAKGVRDMAKIKIKIRKLDKIETTRQGCWQES
jgi:hypothetical protein